MAGICDLCQIEFPEENLQEDDFCIHDFRVIHFDMLVQLEIQFDEKIRQYFPNLEYGVGFGTTIQKEGFVLSIILEEEYTFNLDELNPKIKKSMIEFLREKDYEGHDPEIELEINDDFDYGELNIIVSRKQ